jgi:phosphoglycerate dehydrogenase-like enzyme
LKDPTPVAVASRSFSHHPVLREELLSRYSHVVFNEKGKTLSGELLVQFLKGCRKAIVGLEILDEKIFSSLPELKIVSKYGVGLDMIDLEAMERHGILLGWAEGVNKRSVAELVISSMIALLHRLPEANEEIRSGQWRQTRGRQLTGKTVGIIGCGNVGKDLVVLLKNFKCRILVNDILDFPEFYRKHKITPLNLEELLRRADVVTLHVPLDDSTRNLLNAERLELLKNGAYLINMARGGLVNEVKLKKMLKEGRLGGGALDVFNNEPPDDMELLQLPNVIATPHIGGSTEEAVLAMGRAAISGLDKAQEVSRVIPSYLKKSV